MKGNAGGMPPRRVESSEDESKSQRLTQGVWEAVLEPVFPYTGTTLNMGADSENKHPPPAYLRPGKHQRNTTSAPAGDSEDVTCIPPPSVPPPLEVVPGCASSEGSWAVEPGRPRGVSPERRARSQSLRRGRG